MPPVVYRARHLDARVDRTFDAVMVRLRGPGAGASMSFLLGRLRYHADGKSGELWARFLCGRYELTDLDWTLPDASPSIDRQVGKRQQIAVEFTDGTVTPRGREGETWLSGREPGLLFERWSQFVFERAIARVGDGEGFLPEDVLKSASN